MATVANPFGTDQEEQSSSTSGGGATSSAPSTPSSTPGMATSTGNKPSSSGSFTNINKYINANKDIDADQGGMAGKVSNNISQQAQQQSQNLQGAQNAFNQQAQQNVSTYNNMGAVNQAAADPYGFMQSNPQGMQQVQAAENAEYKGPSGFESLSGSQNLNNLQTQNSNLQNLAKQTQSQAGQFNLLKQMFGTPSYTRGQQGLDQAIMNNTAGAQDQFAKARQSASQAGAGLNASEQQAQNQAQQYGQQAQQIGENARGTLNNAVGNVNTQLSGKLNDFTKQGGTQETLIANAQKQLASGQISPEVYAALGGDKSGIAAGQYLYGLDPTSFITKGAAPTVNQLASTQDYNKLNALNQLLGTNANVDNQSFLGQFSDPGKAGTAGTGVNFNQTGFQNALKDAQGNYNNTIGQENTGYGNQYNTINSQLGEVQHNYTNYGGDPVYGQAILKQSIGLPLSFQEKSNLDAKNSLNNLTDSLGNLTTTHNQQLTNLQKLMGNKISLAQPAQTASIPSDQGVYQ